MAYKFVISTQRFVLFIGALVLSSALLGRVVEFDWSKDGWGKVDAQAEINHYEGVAGISQSIDGHGISVPVPDGIWQSRGTLAFLVRIEGVKRTTDLFLSGAVEPVSMSLLESPVFSARLLVTNISTDIEFSFPLEEKGHYSRLRLPLSHLKGSQWYHLAIAWDLDNLQAEVYLNGILQILITNEWLRKKPQLNPSYTGPLKFLGSDKNSSSVELIVGPGTLIDRFLEEDEVAQSIAHIPLKRHGNEGRHYNSAALDLDQFCLKQIYEADFTKTLNLLHENELFENNERRPLPAGVEWVLEGAGTAWVEEGKLHLKTLKPDQRDGNIVLWNTRDFPGNFLIEYSFEPENTSRGLHILFFSAKANDGASIFESNQPLRNGVFTKYTQGDIKNYHVSPWATTDFALRRTANLRKNSGFHLVACGNDNIGGHDGKVPTVRILKYENLINVESNGKQVLAFSDDGQTYGPVYKGGKIGFRFMSRTHHAAIKHMKVYSVSRIEVIDELEPGSENVHMK